MPRLEVDKLRQQPPHTTPSSSPAQTPTVFSRSFPSAAICMLAASHFLVPAAHKLDGMQTGLNPFPEGLSIAIARTTPRVCRYRSRPGRKPGRRRCDNMTLSWRTLPRLSRQVAFIPTRPGRCVAMDPVSQNTSAGTGRTPASDARAKRTSRHSPQTYQLGLGVDARCPLGEGNPFVASSRLNGTSRVIRVRRSA